MSDQPLFAVAGLWDVWKALDGSWLQSFSIVTTEANELMSQAHNRMPLILEPQDYRRWLSRDDREQPSFDLLRPFDSERMFMLPAHSKVGNVRNQGPEMLNST